MNIPTLLNNINTILTGNPLESEIKLILQSINTEYEFIIDKFNLLEDRLTNVFDEVTEMSNIISDKDQLLKKEIENTANLEKIISTLNFNISDINREIDTLRVEKYKYIQNEIKLEEENKSLSEHINENKNQLMNLAEDINKLNLIIEKNKNQLIHNKSEIDNYKNKYDELQIELMNERDKNAIIIPPLSYSNEQKDVNELKKPLLEPEKPVDRCFCIIL
jgi:chromosome segregation ATPase